MKNSSLILLVVIFSILGVSLGAIFFFYSNSTSDDLYDLNEPPISGELTNLSGNSLPPDETILTEPDVKSKKEIDAKAVYLTGWTAGTLSKRASVIEDINKYGFNAVVIDIKDEAGSLSYNSNVQTAIDISASRKMIKDISAVIEDFHNADIYVIGRIVTFKDPTYAKKVTENAYKTADGSLWRDYSNNNWPNPYNRATWEYPVSLAKEAAELGFDEIQFDYIRFPSSEGKTKNIVFGFDSDTKTKSDVINEFLRYAMDELKDYGVSVSADVFGITTKKRGDFEHIGQDFYEIAKIVDVICPMIYPSHYGYGEYGIKAPDTQPYKIVRLSLEDALKQYNLESGDLKLAKIRPYLQDFTATWLKKGNYITYNTSAVAEQLQACYDLNIHEFTLWDPNNKYAYEALPSIKEKEIEDSADIENAEQQTSANSN